MGDISRDHTSRVCGPRDYESQFRGEGSKSGVPDRDRENSLCANFQDVGAKTFKVLSSPDHKMQMKHFASCVGVNNIECEPHEKEHEVVPFSCASRGNVDMLGTSRLLVGGGVLRCSHVIGWASGIQGEGLTYHVPKEAEHSVATNAHYGSRIVSVVC